MDLLGGGGRIDPLIFIFFAIISPMLFLGDDLIGNSILSQL